MTLLWTRRTTWALWLVLVFSTTTFGQQVLRGSIAGGIKDDTGAALPGVTVSVSGPALQVPQIVRVSNERGEYQIVDLPAGTYKVQYELVGFGTLVREGIILTTGFAARVDVSMKVAALAETVTVSGQSPVVDVTTTRGGTTVSKETIAAIPTNLNFRDVLLLVGGIPATNAPKAGTISSQAYTGTSYGAGNGTALVDGLKMTNSENANMTAYEEVDVKTFGNTADIDAGGAAIQLVVKSGGNEFHGRYNEIAQHKRFQSENIDDTLRAQGVTTGDASVWYHDFAGDLGGRIIRDKLWFYGNIREANAKFTVTGFSKAPGPDGAYGTADDEVAFPTADFLDTASKISYQATSRHKFIGMYATVDNHNPLYYDRYTPVESTNTQAMLMHQLKPIEWQGALSNKWLVNMFYGYGGADTSRAWQPQNGDPSTPWIAGSGAPSVFDRTTGQRSGPGFNDSTLRNNRTYRKSLTATINYLPARTFLGSHAFQTGYRVWEGTYGYINPSPGEENVGIGEYQLIFDTVGGVPHQPAEILAKNLPVDGEAKQAMHGIYIMDGWRPTNRLTLNLGLRWERQLSWVPPQTKAQGYLAPFGTASPIGTSGSFPKVDVGTWNALAPRVGAAYDVSGDGKTVVKGTYGWFNTDLEATAGSNGYALAFSQNSQVQYSYRWNDLNRDGKYQPGEVNLALNGPDFLNVSGATNNLINRDLRLPHTHELTGSVERELAPGLSLRGLFVYKRLIDMYTTVNIARPLSAWDQRFDRRDPGPDGTINTPDDGQVFQIYDYNPVYRGAAFVQNMQVNADSDRHDSFKNFEVMLTKRATGRWFANTSFLAMRNHIWRALAVQSPNDKIFPVANYWDFTYLLSGGYSLPYGVNVSALYQAYNGIARQRINVFRAVDPAGGARFPSSSTFSLPMEERGTKRGPFRDILNLRIGKDFGVGSGRRIMASVDAFNAFNRNTAWGFNSSAADGPLGITETSGPTYNYIYNIVQPRMLRFNLGFAF